MPDTKLTAGQRAVAFADEILTETFAGRDLDGIDLQEMAIRHGLVAETAFDPNKHRGDGSEYCEPGDQWYTYSRAFKLAVKAVFRIKGRTNA